MKQIAFLRAINIGGRRVKMDVLRQIFEGIAGISQVETFIASGNVIFETDAHPDALKVVIEATLQAQLGYDVDTFIRTIADLAHIAQHQPFQNYNPDTDSLYIAFLGDAPSVEAMQKLQTFTSDLDKFHLNRREIYWLCHKSISQSPFSNAKLEKALAMPATLRDISTVHKLLAKYTP